VDEFSFMAQLVEEQFNPSAFASIFTQAGPQLWAEQLISDARGRRLIYSLASKHGHDLFLGWAIKRCLQLGHEADLAIAGHAMAGYFCVYHR
jgi:TH1 protein